MRAFPLMVKLADDKNAVLGLWQVTSRDRMQLVVHAESRAEMRLRLADAQRQPLGAGAGGRALAAIQNLDLAELERRFAAVRWQRSLAFGDYVAQISEAARKGFATDRGFAHRDVLSIAVAIAEPSPGFCLSASLLSASMREAQVARLATELMDILTAAAAAD